jgi:hypothetical protein
VTEIVALLDQAKTCARLALQTQDAEVKDTLIVMAQNWMHQAERLTRREINAARYAANDPLKPAA